MNTEEDLLNRLKTSREVASSGSAPLLLDLLWEKRSTKLSSSELETLFAARDPTSRSEGYLRQIASDLKRRLKDYYESHLEEGILCDLPDAKQWGGYQLLLTPISATKAFWSAHMKSGEELNVICDPHLFFYRHADGRVLRFVNTNIKTLSRTDALNCLKEKHKDEFDPSLTAGHLYVEAGAINGAEAVRQFFWESEAKRTPLLLEKVSAHRSWAVGAPVIFGTGRTNEFAHSILTSQDAAGLGYRISVDRFAWVEIVNPTTAEKAAVDGIGRIEWSGDSFTTTSRELTIGIVTRIPNPRSYSGVITFISSDAGWSMEKMAQLLTDERLLRPALATTGWLRKESLPNMFEMLFVIELWPGNADDVGRVPRLLAWRPRTDEVSRS